MDQYTPARNFNIWQRTDSKAHIFWPAAALPAFAAVAPVLFYRDRGATAQSPLRLLLFRRENQATEEKAEG